MSDSETELEAFDPVQRSATLRKLLPTLTPFREERLIRIAKTRTKPEWDPSRCCGSSCDPCTKVLYGQELRIWKECRKSSEPIPEREPITIAVETQAPKKKEPEKASSTNTPVSRLWSW